jgi:hypothetical protein
MDTVIKVIMIKNLRNILLPKTKVVIFLKGLNWMVITYGRIKKA